MEKIALAMSAASLPITGLFLEELETELVALGQPKYRARQVARWIFEKRADSFEAMRNLPAALRTALAERFTLGGLVEIRRQGSADATQKFLFRLSDGNLIETVLIPASPALYGEAADRRTLCVSSQVGCAYGCRFCASGLDGWTRDLSAGEIVEQVLRVGKLSGERIHNIVFMGMGEPLANFDNLMRAIRILNAPWGAGLGARHMTVSTSGLAPRIEALADQPLQIRLALSLHGATDAVRDRIMPVNRRFNVSRLMEACAYYNARKKQRITFEYILIDGVNDGLDEAAALAGHARATGAKVNCIPYNKVEGLEWQRPSGRRQEAFLAVLKRRGVDATLRLEKGHDIDAACGQLRLQTQRSKPLPAEDKPAIVA